MKLKRFFCIPIAAQTEIFLYAIEITFRPRTSELIDNYLPYQ